MDKNTRIFGKSAQREGYEVRDFLARSVVEFDWVEVTDEGHCREELGLEAGDRIEFPVVELSGGELLMNPTPREVAAKLGWVSKPKHDEYDLSIYGAGPAGLSAAVYAASEGLRTVLIEKHAVGGSAGTTSLIENYMGFSDGIRGAELAERARRQAVKFGCELIMMSEGVKAEFRDRRIHVTMADGSTLVAKANICATGVEYRRLGLENEDSFLGKGLYYGAGASEAPYCADENIVVVGAGNSAGQAVSHFAEHAKRVTMLVRGTGLAESMSDYLKQRIEELPNVDVLYERKAAELLGERELKGVALGNSEDERVEEVEASRMFVCIGGQPNTEWAKDTDIVRVGPGYLSTGPDLLDKGAPPPQWTQDRLPYYLETSVPGSFAAGDVRHKSVKRVASAVGEGAMAVSFVHRYLSEEL